MDGIPSRVTIDGRLERLFSDTGSELGGAQFE
jgi:hypothetical protein